MIIKPLICIPTYNNQATITDVVKGALDCSALDILVIDDGSEKKVDDIFKETNFSSKRVQVVSFEINSGKGVALRRAITFASKNGYTHIIAMDGDGQHLAKDIIKFENSINKNPYSLIIGKRKFVGENVPDISKFGRKFSNFWVKYQTGFNVLDSQSGFRAYPIFLVQCMNFVTKRYDFEIEILVRFLWAKGDVKEVEIDVVYQPSDLRVSHFNKIYDNVRISLLNTFLVIMSMYRGGMTRAKISLALGVGIFVGCSPFFGLHTPIVILLSLILRLNVLIMWIGSNISIPIIAPFLTFLSIYVGYLLTGTPIKFSLNDLSIDFIKAEFFRFLLGSLVVGGVLGIVIGVTLFLALKKRDSKQKKVQGKIRGGRFGNWFLVMVLKHLGRKSGYFCLRFITPYFYLFAPKARRALLEYWRVVTPEIGNVRLMFKIIAHFYTFGTILMDRLFQTFKKGKVFNVINSGDENLVSTYDSEKGLIVIGSHFGGWDFSISSLESFKIVDKFFVVKQTTDMISFEKLKGGEDFEKVVVNKTSSPILEIKSLLEEGCIIAFMGDRVTSKHYELVPFLGKLIPIDTTPFKIAATLKVDIVYFFSAKEGYDDYSFHCTKNRTYRYESSVSKDEQLRLWAMEYVSELENFVKKYPDQWFNFYNIWSDRSSF